MNVETPFETTPHFAETGNPGSPPTLPALRDWQATSVRAQRYLAMLRWLRELDQTDWERIQIQNQQ